MTLEEIKETVSMRDVLARYGVSINRNGMCCCPIHGEQHASMKVYSDGYKCFACNSAGDIFKFVQEMEKCDFKQAFKLLGGSYNRFESKMARTSAMARIQRQKQAKQRAEEDEKKFRQILMTAISMCEFWINNRDPFSEDWCYAQNRLPWLWGVYEEKYLNGERINEIHVFRTYREIRQRFVTV